jgi:hypothetical protein
VAGGEAAEADGLVAPDVVLDGGMPVVTDLQELGGALAGERRVGEEDLMPQAFVLVGQGQLGAGVRALAAHDDAGAVRIAGKVDDAGRLGDLGAAALSVRTRMSVPCRWTSGICASASSSTAM